MFLIWLLMQGAAMSIKDNLRQAHQTMTEVLDQKFQNVPEWKAFRAIDKALFDLIVAPSAAASNGSGTPRSARITSELSYVELGIEAVNEAREPVPTAKIIEFISTRREISVDRDRARVTIGSSLSKSNLLTNVHWRGGRAWWHANQPVPIGGDER
jgi:hypothetical protein